MFKISCEKGCQTPVLQIQIETIVEVKNRKQNLSACSKWIFILEDIQQKSDSIYCIWGV